MERQYLNQRQKAIAPPQPKNAIARSSTHPIEELQSASGNRAVNQLLASQPTLQAKPMFRGLSQELAIQPKLSIGAVGDKYEQEADRVASHVVEQLDVPATTQLTTQQAASPKLPTKLDVIQRADTIQDEDDNIFDYGDEVSETSLNKKVILRKDKILYKSKGTDKKDKIKDLKKGSFVEVLTPPSSSNFFRKSWAKVKYKEDEGWINTKNAIGAPESGKIAEHGSAGVVMPNGIPTVNDVKQMMFGDCFLLAALMSLVQRQPSFVKDELFKTDPTKDADRHTLRFFKVERQTMMPTPPHYGTFDPVSNAKFTSENVTVDNTILKFQSKFETANTIVEKGTNVGSAGVQDWPAIVEKAFAKWPGKNQSDIFNKTNLIAGGTIEQASMFLTGKGYENISTYVEGEVSDHKAKIDAGLASNEEEAKQQIVQENRENLKAKIINTFQSKSDTLIGAGTKDEPPEEWSEINNKDGQGGSGESKVGGIVFRHAYSIVNADEKEIYLRNPWGRYSRVRGEVKPDEAISILTWDEFLKVFNSVSIGV